MGGLTADRIQDLYSVGQLVILAAARPLGFALIFTAFAWGHLNSGLLRIAFGLVLALPVMAPLWLVAKPTLGDLPGPVILFIAKDLFLGAVIGFLASLPFEALGVAGAIVDNYRGSGSPLSRPTGEATPHGQVFVVIGLWLFASLDGFWLVTDVIFTSYDMWPMLELLPLLTTDGLSAFLAFLGRLGRFALMIAGPLLILMMSVDLIFAVAGKLGKQLNVTYLTISVKNLVAVISLPFVAMVIVRVVSGEIHALSALDVMIRAAIR